MIARRRLALISVITLATVGTAWFALWPREGPSAIAVEPWHFEFVVDAEVDGQSIHIERTIECLPIWREAPGFDSIKSFYPRRYLTSQKLADGSGIMIVNPDVCRRNTPVEFGYDPVILWANDADNPTTIEAYYDTDALKKGLGRIKLVSVRVNAPVTGKPEQSAADFIDWSGGVGRLELPKGKRLRFGTAYAVEVPAALWQTDNRIKAELATKTIAGAVDRPLLDLLATAFPPPVERPFIDAGFYPSPDHPSIEDVINRPLRMRDVIPMRIVGDHLETDLSARGTLVFYVQDEIRKVTTSKGPRDAIVAGHKVSGNLGAGSYVWIPEDQRLFLMTDPGMSFVLNPE